MHMHRAECRSVMLISVKKNLLLHFALTRSVKSVIFIWARPRFLYWAYWTYPFLGQILLFFYFQMVKTLLSFPFLGRFE
jgi:hypothetical protein